MRWLTKPSIAPVLAGLAVLLFAAARPEREVALPRIQGTVILAFDVSGSMAANDMAPTRMEAAKAAARAFIDEQPADVQIGIVAFSDSGFSVQPATNEKDAVLAALGRLKPERGTSLANGILVSLKAIAAANDEGSTHILIEPQIKTTEVPKVLGIDGKEKMSKSLNNHIELAATPEETRKRVLEMVTDPARIKRSDPGNPDICNVYTMHKVFSPQADVDMVNVECRRAGIGCVDCKRLLAKNMNANLAPFRTWVKIWCKS